MEKNLKTIIIILSVVAALLIGALAWFDRPWRYDKELNLKKRNLPGNDTIAFRI